jgi:hypothetical protein
MLGDGVHKKRQNGSGAQLKEIALVDVHCERHFLFDLKRQIFLD